MKKIILTTLLLSGLGLSPQTFAANPVAEAIWGQR